MSTHTLAPVVQGLKEPTFDQAIEPIRLTDRIELRPPFDEERASDEARREQPGRASREPPARKSASKSASKSELGPD